MARHAGVLSRSWFTDRWHAVGLCLIIAWAFADLPLSHSSRRKLPNFTTAKKDSSRPQSTSAFSCISPHSCENQNDLHWTRDCHVHKNGFCFV